MPNTIDKLLERAHKERASDLHLSEGIPAVYRIDGQLRQLDERVFTSTDLEKMAKKIIPKS